MRLLKFAHVTYLATPGKLQAIRNDPATSIIMDARAVSVPQFKRELCPGADASQDMLLIQRDYPTEFLSDPDMPDSVGEVPRLPSRALTAHSVLEILSSSFTQATLREFGELFNCVPHRGSLRLELPLGAVTLTYDEHAPPFSDKLCSGPGPVSIAFYCRGLNSFIAGGESKYTSAEGPAATPAGTFWVVLVRCGLVWFELLQRLERNVR